MDDELELIAVLQEFCRIERKQVEVYFDGAPVQHAGTRKLGKLTAHFVPLGKTADDAIRRHLKRLGNSAKNWIVVTSDRQIQAEARGANAEIIPSDSFAKMLKRTRRSAPKATGDHPLSDTEVAEWMQFFEKGGKKE
jgi:predicted RNA-binding protein with PIN domain